MRKWFYSSPNILLQIWTQSQNTQQKKSPLCGLSPIHISANRHCLCFSPAVAPEWLLYGTYNMLTLSLWKDRGLLLWNRKWPRRTPGDLRGKVITFVWPFCLSWASNVIYTGWVFSSRQQCAGNSLRGASLKKKMASDSLNIDNFLKIFSNVTTVKY